MKDRIYFSEGKQTCYFVQGSTIFHPSIPISEKFNTIHQWTTNNTLLVFYITSSFFPMAVAGDLKFILPNLSKNLGFLGLKQKRKAWIFKNFRY